MNADLSHGETAPRSDVDRTKPRALVALLVFAAVLAYANSFGGAFVFDDRPAIVDNATIRSFSPLWRPLVPPTAGSTGGRPIVNLSFALNFAAGGLDPRGYHAVNLLIHLSAGLLLFGIVRRTAASRGAPGWLRTDALFVATSTALLWLVHPLQTESVTSIVQRTESLGSVFYLATLYAFIRAAADGDRRWFVASVGACAIGVGTKEIVATAPLAVFLYDRTFVAGSFAAAWRARRGYYLSLAGTWVVLGVLMVLSHARGGTATLDKGFGVGVTLLTQVRAVATYLALAGWPHPLVIDYGSYATDAVRGVALVWPQALILVALLGFTLFALVKSPRWGFVAAWFFIVLAPSSSFVPLLSQARAEHRMYLALAAVLVAVVVLIRVLLRRFAPVVIAGFACAFVALTSARNLDYRTPVTLWTATVRAFPSNPRAQLNLGDALREAGDAEGAVHSYQNALRNESADDAAQAKSVAMLAETHHFAEALPLAQAAVQKHPQSAAAHEQLGRILLALGDDDGALREARAAVQLEPTSAAWQKNLALILVSAGRPEEAITHLRHAAELQPEAETWAMLGTMLRQTNQPDAARAALESALKLRPGDGLAQWQYGELLLGAGAPGVAVEYLTRAAQVMPRSAPVQLDLALALAASGRQSEAVQHAEAAIKLDPKNPAAAEVLEKLRASAVR